MGNLNCVFDVVTMVTSGNCRHATLDIPPPLQGHDTDAGQTAWSLGQSVAELIQE